MPLALPNVPGIASLAPSDEEAAQWGMAPQRPPSAPPPPPAAPPEMIASAEVDQGTPPIADASASGSDVNAQPVEPAAPAQPIRPLSDFLRGPRPRQGATSATAEASASSGASDTEGIPGTITQPGETPEQAFAREQNRNGGIPRTAPLPPMSDLAANVEGNAAPQTGGWNPLNEGNKLDVLAGVPAKVVQSALPKGTPDPLVTFLSSVPYFLLGPEGLESNVARIGLGAGAVTAGDTGAKAVGANPVLGQIIGGYFGAKAIGHITVGPSQMLDGIAAIQQRIGRSLTPPEVSVVRGFFSGMVPGDRLPEDVRNALKGASDELTLQGEFNPANHQAAQNDAALNEARQNAIPETPAAGGSPTATATTTPATAPPPAGDVGAAPPAGPPHEPPAAPEGDAAATTLRNLFGVETPVPQLTRWQSTLNAIKNVVGGTPDEPIAAGAFRVLRAGRQSIEAQANRFGAVASQIVKEGGFNLDKDGRAVDLPGKPTIQDVAARLPEFEAQLSPTQLQAMRDLQQETAPFAEALKAQGVEIASRADVQDGGFYLPRGRADLEGADAVSGGGGGGRVGGKKGFERSATFESMGHGLDAGYKYAEFGDAMQAYARDAGNRALDTYVGDYFKNVTDEAGNKLAETAADRVNPGLRDQVSKLRGQIASRLDTLAQQTARGGANDLAQRRVTAIYDAIEKRVQAATEKLSFAGDRITPVSPTDEAIIRAKEELSALERAQTPVRNAAKAAADTASATWERSAGTRSDLGDLRNELNGIEGDWNQAKRIAQQTPRGQGSIHDFSGLQGYSFPDEVANAANKYLDQMKPPSGAGTAPIVVIRAVNNLLRGLRASTDLSFMGIQGLLGLGHDPGAYGQALKVGIQSMADKAALGAFLRDFDKDATTKGLPTSREWAAAGLHFGGREHEFTIGKGLGGLGEAIGSAPVIKQSNRSFGYFGDSLRPALAQDMFDNPGFMSDLRPGGEAASTLTGAERTTAMKQIADASNLLTGWSRGRFLGDFGDLAQFAPRFFQSQLELIGKAATDGSMTGDQARKALVKLAGYGTLITVGANSALGNDKDSGFDYLTPLKNGNLNPNFMRIRIPGGPSGGRDVSLFGPWDSLLRGVVAAGGGDPGYLARTKASPAVQAGIDLVTGKDFNGKDVGGATVAGIKTGNANYWLHNLLPFSISGQGSQSPLTDPLGTTIGLSGLKESPESFSERRDQLARQAYDGRGYDKLDYGERKAVDAKAKEQGIASSQPPSQNQAQGDAAKARFATEDGDTARAFTAGTLNQPLKDNLHDTSMKRLGSGELLNGFYDAAGVSPQSDFAKRFETLMNGYQHQVVTNAENQIDWQATKDGQAKYLAALPDAPGKDGSPSDRKLFQSYLDYAEANKSKLAQRVDTFNQSREAAGYYAPKADTTALDKSHPDLDVEGWYLGGGYQTKDGPAAPALQTTNAVDKALQIVQDEGLQNRPVKLAGLPRPVNESPGTVAAWKANEGGLNLYLNTAVPKYQDSIATQLYQKPFDKLQPAEQDRVTSSIKTQIRDGSPAIAAALAYFGVDGALHSQAAFDAWRAMVKQYGPGFQSPPGTRKPFTVTFQP